MNNAGVSRPWPSPSVALPPPRPRCLDSPHLLPALAPLPRRLSDQHLVDLLKHPLFVGKPREMVLDLLGNRHGRRFVDPWEFVQFAQERRLDLDFTTPPARPEPAPLPAQRKPRGGRR